MLMEMAASAEVQPAQLWCMWVGVQEMHGGALLKISSAAEDDFVRLNLLWTGFFGETCEPINIWIS